MEQSTGLSLVAMLSAALLAAHTYAEPPERDTKGRTAMTMSITSTAFAAGGTIPRKYTGEGGDISPPLAWESTPGGTEEFALICDDPDAPTPKPWVHWVLYKIPADRTALAEGDNAGAVEGKTGWGSPGYRGPMPPPGHGVHRYYFRLYALDEPLSLAPGASKEELLAAMEGHILAEA